MPPGPRSGFPPSAWILCVPGRDDALTLHVLDHLGCCERWFVLGHGLIFPSMFILVHSVHFMFIERHKTGVSFCVCSVFIPLRGELNKTPPFMAGLECRVLVMFLNRD